MSRGLRRDRSRERPEGRLVFFQPEGLSLRHRVTATHNGSPRTFSINPDGFFGLKFCGLPEGGNGAFLAATSRW